MTKGSPATLAGIGVGAVTAGYAWWVTGVPPFTTRAYIAVAVPALLLILAALIGPSSRRDKMTSPTAPEGPHGVPRVFPWVILLLLALALEGVGLALGGRSHAVPTLSTVIDHAMSQHISRFFLLCFWLTAGWVPIVRMIRRAPTQEGGVD